MSHAMVRLSCPALWHVRCSGSLAVRRQFEDLTYVLLRRRLGIGNVSFTSCEVDDSVARPWLSATAGFTDVSATKMVVRNKYGCTTAGLAVQAQCEP